MAGPWDSYQSPSAAPPAAGPWDAYKPDQDPNTIGNILSKFGRSTVDAVSQTKKDILGDQPLPTPDTAFSPETEKTLKKWGILGHANAIQNMFDGVIRTGAAALELAGRVATGVAGQTLKKIGGSEASDTAEAQALGMGFLGGPEENFEATLARGRAKGIVGEGEAGYYDAVTPTPENTEARASAAKEAGIPEPPVQEPPKGVHELARRIEPEAIQKFDALEIEKEQQQRTLSDLSEEPESPEAEKARQTLADIQKQQDDLIPVMQSAYRQAFDAMVPAEETGPKSALTISEEHDQAVARLFTEADAAMGKDAPKAAKEPIPEPPVVKPKEEGTGSGLKPIEGTGELKTRTLAEGVEAKAIEDKLTSSFGDLPEYHQVSMADQAAKSQEYLGKDYENAKAVAMGRKAPPKGVLPESIFVAVEKRALAEGDVETLRELATNSKLTTAATTMGQRIRTLGERDPASPIGAIQEVQAAREAEHAKRGNIEEAKQTEVKAIKTEMKRSASKRPVWEDFINKITCEGE